MREWDVVLVIVVLLNIGLSIYNPVSKSQKENTRAMTELTMTMKAMSDKLMNFEKDIDALSNRNHDSHKRIWEKNEAQDEKLNDHENRIIKMEENHDK